MFVCNDASKFHYFVQIFWYGDDTGINWVASSGWQSRWRVVIRLLVVGLRGSASSLSPEVACPWQKRLDISINANSLFNFMFSLILPRLRAPRSEFILKILGHQWAKRWKYEGVSIASSPLAILVPKKTMTKKIRRGRVRRVKRYLSWNVATPRGTVNYQKKRENKLGESK